MSSFLQIMSDAGKIQKGQQDYRDAKVKRVRADQMFRIGVQGAEDTHKAAVQTLDNAKFSREEAELRKAQTMGFNDSLMNKLPFLMSGAGTAAERVEAMTNFAMSNEAEFPFADHSTQDWLKSYMANNPAFKPRAANTKGFEATGPSGSRVWRIKNFDDNSTVDYDIGGTSPAVSKVLSSITSRYQQAMSIMPQRIKELQSSGGLSLNLDVELENESDPEVRRQKQLQHMMEVHRLTEDSVETLRQSVIMELTMSGVDEETAENIASTSIAERSKVKRVDAETDIRNYTAQYMMQMQEIATSMGYATIDEIPDINRALNSILRDVNSKYLNNYDATKSLNKLAALQKVADSFGADITKGGELRRGPDGNSYNFVLDEVPDYGAPMQDDDVPTNPPPTPIGQFMGIIGEGAGKKIDKMSAHQDKTMKFLRRHGAKLEKKAIKYKKWKDALPTYEEKKSMKRHGTTSRIKPAEYNSGKW